MDRPSEIQDLYERLNIDKHANSDQIKRAYRLLAFQWHPDRNRDHDEVAHLEFIAVSEAFEVLYDPNKREMYDLTHIVESFRTQRSEEQSSVERTEHYKTKEKPSGEKTEHYRTQTAKQKPRDPFLDDPKMILQLLHIMVGLLFGLFIPGFLLTLILFKKIDLLERIALSIGLSIAVDVFVGLFLGANQTMKEITGGITEFGVWLYLIAVSIIFILIYITGILIRKKTEIIREDNKRFKSP